MVTAAIPATPAQALPRMRVFPPRPFSVVVAPALFAVLCFAAGILVSRLAWFLPGLFLLALLAAFAVAIVASAKAPRLAWATTALVYVLLGALCAEIAPAINPQQKLALLANNTQRTVQGTIVRLGPLRTETSQFFSSEESRERSRQFDLRLGTTGTARMGVYAPLDQAFPKLACGDVVRLASSLHQAEVYLDPGVWNYRDYLLKQGIGALGSTRPERLAVIARPRPRFFVLAALASGGGKHSADRLRVQSAQLRSAAVFAH